MNSILSTQHSALSTQHSSLGGRSLFSTIRARLYWLVAVALLPALAILIYNGFQIRRRAIENVREDAVRVISLTGQELQSLIEGARVQLRLLARTPEVRAMDDSSSRRFREILNDEHHYTNIGVADAGGKVVSSAVPVAGDFRVNDRFFFRRVIDTGEFAVGHYRIDPLSGKPGLDIGYPLRDEDSRLRGVIFASLGTEWATNFVKRADLPSDTTLLIVDREGLVLARSLEPEKVVGKNFAQVEVVQRMMGASAPGADVLTGVDGTRRLNAFAPIRSGRYETNAIAGIGIPLAAATGEANRSLIWNFGFLLLGTIASFGIARFVAEKFFLRETRGILKAARGLEAGDLTASSGLPPGEGELRHMAIALDSGIASLRAAQIERERMEAEIREREARLAAVLDNSPAVITVKNLESQYELVNYQFEMITGHATQPSAEQERL